LKRKIDYNYYLNNKKSLLNKKYYYCIGFDVIDYVVFELDYFYYDRNDLFIKIKESMIIKIDSQNNYGIIKNMKFCHFFDSLQDSRIKELTSEKHAKILLQYGA
jgi:hypothetical protein